MVDEWLQKDGERYLRPEGGAPPRLSDAEMLTLLAHQLSQATWRERRWLRYLRRNYQQWFPNLTSQSAYNRRARNLSGVCNALRIELAQQVSAQLPPEGVVDGTPIHVPMCDTGAGTALTIWHFPKLTWATVPPNENTTTVAVTSCWLLSV